MENDFASADLTPEGSETYVWVRRQWNDYRKAKYALKDLSNVDWDTVSGGVRQLAPQPYLMAYVYCDALLEGELAHTCRHGPSPHLIKVCIVDKDNEPRVIRKLRKEFGRRPPKGLSKRLQALELIRSSGALGITQVELFRSLEIKSFWGVFVRRLENAGGFRRKEKRENSAGRERTQYVWHL